MSPELVKQLRESPQGAQFIEFVRAQVATLDSIDALPDNPEPVAFAIEAKARKRAQLILAAILRPLLDDMHTPAKDKRDSYEV